MNSSSNCSGFPSTSQRLIGGNVILGALVKSTDDSRLMFGDTVCDLREGSAEMVALV